MNSNPFATIASEELKPDGFKYVPDVFTESEEREIISQIEVLPFKPFEFHGFLGKRRIVSFGWRYDYSDQKLKASSDIPPFLTALRETASTIAAAPSTSFEQVLVTEYAPGAGIGWHKDKPIFEDIVAFSFLSACVLRFRKKNGAKWDRLSMNVEPRSAYLLRGAVRRQWEHSIPVMRMLRYSITFRNFASVSRIKPKLNAE